MNYPRNRTTHKPGDLILHDYDNKQPFMVMRFIRYMPDGKGQTEYLDPELRRSWGKGEKSKLINRNSVLHKADRFGVTAYAPQ